MEIDWKHLASTPAYKSMKAAVADEAKRTAKWNRKPDERYAQAFNFAINRAKHYAHHHKCPIENVISNWENNRDCNFISYYSDHRFPKFHSNNKKPMGIRGLRKYYKAQSTFYGVGRGPKRIHEFHVFNRKNGDNPKKSRWPMARKKRGY